MRKNLTTREGRRRLKRQTGVHWSQVHRGLILGWRRDTTAVGTWYVRWLGEDKKYHQNRLGVADDDPKAGMSYEQALESALNFDKSAEDKPAAHFTVWDACIQTNLSLL